MVLLSKRIIKEGVLRLFKYIDTGYIITYEPRSDNSITENPDWEVEIYFDSNRRDAGMEFFRLCTK